MEGGIIFGLTAALKSEITLKDGRVVQSNFYDYPMLRMFESPEIEVAYRSKRNGSDRRWRTRRSAHSASIGKRHICSHGQACPAITNTCQRSRC